MKILFLINQFAGGGRERRMIQLVKGLSMKPEFKMHCIVFTNKIEYEEIYQTSLTYQCVCSKNRKQRCEEIKNIIKEFAPNIIHSWLDTPTEMLLLAHLKKYYQYKYIAGFVADANCDGRYSFKRLAMLYTFKKADAIVSNSLAGLIAKNADMQKGHVIYNGFDFSRIPDKIDKECLRQELNITTKYLAVMCARINEAKDWRMYIEISDKARRNHLDVTFLAVGNGERLQYYRELVERENHNVRFIGRRTDIEKILDITDICFMLTNNKLHAEGISNSIMEAMAVGVPVIASEGGGTAEIITDCHDGYIVKPSDSENAFKIMSRLLTDESLYKNISLNAIKKIQEKFSLDKMTKEYIDLYNSLSY